MEQIVYFTDVSHSLDKIIEELNIKSILLVTGKKSFESSPACAYFNKINSEINIHRIFDFEVNPKYDDILRNISSIKNSKFDVVISIGGGSVMDFAKLLTFYKEDPLYFDMSKTIDYSFKQLIPHIAIPTTAGSGSEATHFAVMYKNGEKYSIANNYLLPNYVILDSSLTQKMPKYLTACSGMDALCQAIESLWAKQATPLSRSFSKEAINVILSSLQQSVKNSSPESREKMLRGAYLAGKAINISKTTGPHALAYYLTEKHDIPHGEAVGLNIDLFLIQNWSLIGKDEKSFLLQSFDATNQFNLAEKIIALKQNIGLKTSLREIIDLNMDNYLDSVNTERMSNNPKPFDTFSLKRILKQYHNL